MLGILFFPLTLVNRVKYLLWGRRQLKAYSVFYLEGKIKSIAQEFFSSRALIFLHSPYKRGLSRGGTFQTCCRTWVSLSVLRLTHPYELFPVWSSLQTFKQHKCCFTDISQHIQYQIQYWSKKLFTKKNIFQEYMYVYVHFYQTKSMQNIFVSLHNIFNYLPEEAFYIGCAGATYN